MPFTLLTCECFRSRFSSSSPHPSFPPPSTFPSVKPSTKLSRSSPSMLRSTNRCSLLHGCLSPFPSVLASSGCFLPAAAPEDVLVLWAPTTRVKERVALLQAGSEVDTRELLPHTKEVQDPGSSPCRRSERSRLLDTSRLDTPKLGRSAEGSNE